jgi:N-acetyl-alpha-D-muramate 1-phosphate uridylyltransferase
MSLPVAILAGGLATRLKPITESIPKSLLRVGGKPFAFHQLELLARQGIRRVVFCVAHLGEQIQDAVGDGSPWGLEVYYSFDGPIRLGTAGALRHALPQLGDEFLVLYGDSYLECPYMDIGTAFQRSGQLGLMTVFRNDDRWDRSNIVFSNGRILRYDKSQQSPDMHYIDYGLGALRSTALEKYAAEEPLDLVDVYQDLIALNALTGYEVENRFYEIGSVKGMTELERYLSTQTM